MNIKVGKKNYELKYTFNSFKHMEDLDFGAMQEVATKPFKVIGMLSILVYGAMNHDRKNYVSQTVSDEVLEKYLDGDGNIMELFGSLTSMLEETGFFKSLQQDEESQSELTEK